MSKPSMNDKALPAGRRVLALWFPYLPVERVLRMRLGRSWRSAAAPERRPLVVSRSEGNVRRVAAFDEKARGLGLRRGMGIADVRAMHPLVEVMEADPEADRRVLEGIADWCDRYTPLVALCGEDGLFLDIAGCAHLFGGEQAMLDDMVGRLSAQGFRAFAGLASTPGMAWAAARYLDGATIAPGGEAEALARLPLAALRLDLAMRGKLESVGLRSVDAVMAAPRAPLARRFGKALLLRLDQALGHVEEAVSPRLPVPLLAVERYLAEPVVTIEDIERLTLLLAQTLKADLERREEGARRLELTLFRVDGAVWRLRIGVSRPLRESRSIQRLFREKLAVSQIDADCGFELVRLAALVTAPFDVEQTDLTSANNGDSTDIAQLADRVRARLGDGAFLQPRMVASHIPERAVMLQPFANAASADRCAQEKGSFVERPISLLAQPEPVEVAAAEVPEGPPLRFRWRRALHSVMRAEGPERIASEWWKEGEDEPVRDYFRIEDDAGRRYWLYRQGLYDGSASAPRWFMHGFFA